MKYHAHNPLQIDVLVVDETSMIDLPMMAKLVQTLKPETRLIFYWVTKLNWLQWKRERY